MRQVVPTVADTSGVNRSEGVEDMKEEDRSRLDSIMTQFEQKLTKSKDAKERRQSEEETFYTEFRRVRTSIIRPAMEEIGNQLIARGHNVDISEVGDERSRRDAKITMSITIGGVVSSAYTPENTVSIAFAHAGHTTISIRASTPIKNRSGFAGARGNYAISEMTTELVEKKLIEVLEEVFAQDRNG